MTCPKCGFENAAGAPECARCGVIFAKASLDELFPRATETAPPARSIGAPLPGRVERTRPAAIVQPSVLLDEVTDGQLGKKEISILAFGLISAIIVYAVPFTRFIFSALVTLFHEFGHAVAGWLLGHVSIPAFDFTYGGGITHTGQFRLSIAVAVGLGFAWLGWHFRENRKAIAVIGGAALVWLFFVTAEWRRETAFAAAGHAGEFILAGIFFYQALSGIGLRAPEIERPAAAFAAFFVQIHSMLFAWRLTRDADFLAWYREGKGGALMNDLEVLALNLQIYVKLNPGIEGVARLLILFSFVPVGVALIWYFQRARWHRVLRALRTVDA